MATSVAVPSLPEPSKTVPPRRTRSAAMGSAAVATQTRRRAAIMARGRGSGIGDRGPGVCEKPPSTHDGKPSTMYNRQTSGNQINTGAIAMRLFRCVLSVAVFLLSLIGAVVAAERPPNVILILI